MITMNPRLVLALLLLCPVSPPALAEAPALDPDRGVMTAAPLLEAVTPAVVNISVRQRLPYQENPLFSDPFFRRFFNLPDQPQRREAISAGSGVIVDAENGYVMTNHHVVDGADEITVTLKDQRRFVASLMGSDSETDIALLQIEPERLSDLPIADSDRLKVGDLVFAIGNPFGLGQTVTTGIISALGRGLGMERFEDFIQTDASINPGNSGGALINSRGELIGINTAIIAPGGGNVGIGFAVPTNMARAVMDQLLRHGEVRRGRIGVSIQDITPDLAAALRLPEPRGAVISQVERGSPAEAAGLEPGDVIVAIDGRAVANAGDLRNRVGLIERGSRVTLTFYRDQERRDVTLEVGELPAARRDGGDTLPQFSGAGFAEIPVGHPAHGNVEGVLVTEVEPGSPPWRMGLRADDIVLAVNRVRVRSLEDLQTEIARGDRVVALNVLRGDTQLFLVMR